MSARRLLTQEEIALLCAGVTPALRRCYGAALHQQPEEMLRGSECPQGIALCPISERMFWTLLMDRAPLPTGTLQ